MTLPAAGTWDFQPFWANPQGVRFEFAETWYNLFLHTAGRVMTLPYGCGTVNGNMSFLLHRTPRVILSEAKDDTGGGFYLSASRFSSVAALNWVR